jgi:hypothetical protein
MNEISEVINNWNPETDSVTVLKDALGQGNQDWVFSDLKLLSSFWADKYAEFSYSAVSEFFCVIAVDSNGYCIFGDCDEVRHVSELELELKESEQAEKHEN